MSEIEREFLLLLLIFTSILFAGGEDPAQVHIIFSNA